MSYFWNISHKTGFVFFSFQIQFLTLEITLQPQNSSFEWLKFFSFYGLRLQSFELLASCLEIDN